METLHRSLISSPISSVPSSITSLISSPIYSQISASSFSKFFTLPCFMETPSSPKCHLSNTRTNSLTSCNILTTHPHLAASPSCPTTSHPSSVSSRLAPFPLIHQAHIHGPITCKWTLQWFFFSLGFNCMTTFK